MARVIVRKVRDHWDEIVLTMTICESNLIPFLRLEAEYAADLHFQLVAASERSHTGVLSVRTGLIKLKLQETDWRALLAALWDWALQVEDEENRRWYALMRVRQAGQDLRREQ